MKDFFIRKIEQNMISVLSAEQMTKLKQVIEQELLFVDVISKKEDIPNYIVSNKKLINNFLSSKTVEGCSVRSIQYYKATLEKVNNQLNIPFKQIETEDLRNYL